MGLGGKGNSGVGGVLTSTNGAIAYVALAYVVSNKFDDAAVQNAAGKFEAPSISTISAAAASLTSVPANNAISIVDPPASAAGAYPISTFTYAIVPNKSPKAKELEAVPHLGDRLGRPELWPEARLRTAPVESRLGRHGHDREDHVLMGR